MLSDEQIRVLWFASEPTSDGRPASWNFARAIEAEVRKQDTELIQQMLAVLEYIRNTPEAEYDSKVALDKAKAAVTAAYTRLENT